MIDVTALFNVSKMHSLCLDFHSSQQHNDLTPIMLCLPPTGLVLNRTTAQGQLHSYLAKKVFTVHTTEILFT